ncbi:hypothetical protein P12x_001738 [Tundrisphaera lichenicola]|uniref:hypothetical protein n=1 Tax=Tundrisphaera lichenicola TaxID=2029860 RepID=UPI003EB8CDCA
MLEPNPYAAPESRPEARSGGSRLGPVRMVLRAVAVIWGFSIMAAPPSHARETDAVAQPVAKAFGAILLLAAFFPFGESPSKSRMVGTPTEDL